MISKPKFLELNSIVSKQFNLNSIVKRQIDNLVFEYHKVFKNTKYHLINIGEYGLKTFIDENKSLEIEFALVVYRPKNPNTEKDVMFKLIEESMNLIHKKNFPARIKQNAKHGYCEAKFVYENKKITFRITPFFFETNKVLGTENYYFWFNDQKRKDHVIEFVRAFNKANKISNGLLRTLVKMIKYVLKDDFPYFYIIHILVLRWFYDYFTRKFDEYLNIKHQDSDISNEQINKYNDIKFQRRWFYRNINGDEIIFYILERLWLKENYYFREFSFQEEEVFTSVSRYSWYTNSHFLIPDDYFIRTCVFNIGNYDCRLIADKLLKQEKISIIAYDYVRSHDNRIYLSPLRVKGYVHLNSFVRHFSKKSEELYKQLDPIKQKEIVSLNQREAIEELNLIAHKWLTIYKQKLTYLKIYFDPKYPMVSGLNYYVRLSTIIASLKQIKDEYYIVGYDN